MSSKDTILTKERQRAIAEAEDRRSFVKRNYIIYVFALIALVAGSVLSAATEGWHIYFRVENIVITGLLIALIEGASIGMGGSAINDIKAGVFSGSNADLALFALKTAIYLGATYYSVTLTLEGASQYAYSQQKEVAPPTLIDKDSIAMAYDTTLLAINTSISKMESTTYRGTITRTANANLQALYAQAEVERNRKEQALKEADKDNADIQADWAATVKEQQGYYKGFSGLGEIVKLAAMIFIAVYRKGRDNEFGIHKLESALGVDIDGDGHVGKPVTEPESGASYSLVTASTDSTPPPPSAPETPERPRIGFKMHWLEDLPGSDSQVLPVATCSNPLIATEMEGQVPISVVKEFSFYKDAKRNYQSWDKHPSATEPTKEKHKLKYQARMDHAITSLSELGYTVEYKNRRHLLIPNTQLTSE